MGVILACDEMFLRHYEQGGGGQFIVRKRTKRVPPTKNKNAKEGCTFMVTMYIDSSQLLMPQIIFTGKSLRFNVNDLIFKN